MTLKTFSAMPITHTINQWRHYGLVSHGAATDGVNPIFFLKKNRRRFLVIAVCKVMTFFQLFDYFCLSTVLSKFNHKIYLFHSGVTSWMLSPPSPRTAP